MIVPHLPTCNPSPPLGRYLPGRTQAPLESPLFLALDFAKSMTLLDVLDVSDISDVSDVSDVLDGVSLGSCGTPTSIRGTIPGAQ